MCKWGVSGVPNRRNGSALHLSQKGYLARVQPAPCLGRVCGTVYAWALTERTAADQTAQHLTAQEQVPAIVAGKD